MKELFSKYKSFLELKIDFYFKLNFFTIVAVFGLIVFVNQLFIILFCFLIIHSLVIVKVLTEYLEKKENNKELSKDAKDLLNALQFIFNTNSTAVVNNLDLKKVKKAYKKRAKELHPDNNGKKEDFQKLVYSKEIIEKYIE